MKRLLVYFIRGLLITLPTVVTGWLLWQIFDRLDNLLGISTPGVGLTLMVVLITVIGFLGSNLVSRSVVSAFEDLVERLPLVRLVYNATKDVIGAFVGEKKRFDKPVVVSMSPDGAIRALGFITQESLAQVGTATTIVVYLPLSYSFAGWTCVVDASRVRRLDTASSEFMAFIVSGGVTDFPPLR